ncbi:CopG family transcriptional regulator [Sulfurimonas sp.]|uniref:CopG family transcriptional regulator n=1 Tax=Sulfurimonas sp. TaxID=2022749 RepID=UPI001A07B3F7|nr:CopG family transcriptional regulator [Sulfurimonas sp.]MBE0515603.1 CopG family transcriptional regulator [Sulfurimonas sp.]
MVATVRLDDNLENTLNRISKILHKKKSDVIREAISFYAQSIEKEKKSRILSAIEKTKDIDKKEFKDFEGTTDDGI